VEAISEESGEGRAGNGHMDPDGFLAQLGLVPDRAPAWEPVQPGTPQGPDEVNG
jgi:hypothetical protein